MLFTLIIPVSGQDTTRQKVQKQTTHTQILCLCQGSGISQKKLLEYLSSHSEIKKELNHHHSLCIHSLWKASLESFILHENCNTS